MSSCGNLSGDLRFHQFAKEKIALDDEISNNMEACGRMTRVILVGNLRGEYLGIYLTFKYT